MSLEDKIVWLAAHGESFRMEWTRDLGWEVVWTRFGARYVVGNPTLDQALTDIIETVRISV
jgi:hypothetical protein